MKKAFTLIELLIVVAIIAILAAIAVPNFLEAQVRAKVSRAVSDMRTLTTGIEVYFTDHNKYPPFKQDGDYRAIFCTTPGTGGSTPVPNSIAAGKSIVGTGFCGVSSRLRRITTPIAYITSIAPEAFQVKSAALGAAGSDDPAFYDTYDYIDSRSFTLGSNFGNNTENNGKAITSGAQWRLASSGPDLIQAFGGSAATGSRANPVANEKGFDYDATNGTVSAGDIVRVGGGPGLGAIEPKIDRIKNIVN